MKALTLHQPWATLIALGVKTVETRSWKAPDSLIGDRFAIHAGQRQPNFGLMYDLAPLTGASFAGVTGWILKDGTHVPMPLGAVVATANLVDCLPMTHGLDEHDGDQIVIAGGGELTLACLGSKFVSDGSEFFDDAGVTHISGRWQTATPEDGYGLFDISDQLPYGDFAPGRWAWMLDGIEPLPEPVLATGRQRLWNWEATP